MLMMPTPLSDAAKRGAVNQHGDVEDEATPSERILVAVETIGAQGPLTYKALESALNLSKATTWRLVATLRDAGWVRFRHGGRLIELDPRLDELFATAHFADAEFTEVSDVMSVLAGRLQVHIDLFAPNRKGELVLHETSRRLTISAPVPDATDENMLVAVHAAMTPPQLERHLAHMAADVDVENARHLTGAAARRRIQQFQGYFWGAGGRFLAVSVRGKMGTAAVLRLSAKANALKPDLLARAYAGLVVMLDGKVEKIGAGRTVVDLP
jgi:DNA-binding IclR family transcriptional regulator